MNIQTQRRRAKTHKTQHIIHTRVPNYIHACTYTALDILQSSFHGLHADTNTTCQHFLSFKTIIIYPSGEHEFTPGV